MSNKIDLAVELMVEVANARTVPADYVSRLYQVEMEVLAKINDIMRDYRQWERGQSRRD